MRTHGSPFVKSTVHYWPVFLFEMDPVQIIYTHTNTHMQNGIKLVPVLLEGSIGPIAFELRPSNLDHPKPDEGVQASLRRVKITRGD